jgi:hypothetical protein
MSLATSPVTGTIRIQPLPWADGSGHDACDDSTLLLLLEAFAHHPELGDPHPVEIDPLRLASTRLRRWPLARGPEVVLRANFAQLLTDLQSEYDQFGLRG